MNKNLKSIPYSKKHERKGAFFMNRRNIIIITVIMILCTTYIFGFEYYDRMPDKVQQLSEQISIPELKVTEVGVELSGIYYGEKLELQNLMIRQNEVLEALAHEVDCSKLCQVFHYIPATTSIEEKENQIKVTAANKSDDTPYYLMIKNQKDKGYNTYYDLKLTGMSSLAQLDMRRSRAKELLKSWKVKPKESIYFKGEIEGELLDEERLTIAETLLKQLKGKMTNTYQDDRNNETVAYYGYTKEIADYIEESNGVKTNIQISFIYSETARNTECIIAFPFYNAPF